MWLPTGIWWKRYWWTVLIALLVIALVCSLVIPIPKAKTVRETVYESDPQLEQQVSALQEELTGTEEELTLAQEELAAVEKELTSAQQQNSGLWEDKTALEEEILSLRDQIRTLEGDKTVLQRQVSSLREQIASLQDQLTGGSQTYIPSPPQIVSTLTHREVLDILRDKFPQAMFRGAEGSRFEVTTLSEIERFLAEDRTDQEDLSGGEGDYVFALMGSFNSPGWETIPIGWAKTDDDIYNVVIAREGTRIKVFGINPATDRLWEISTTSNVKFVLIG